ncbi:hypothetical protein B0H15DRAFT_861605 [Mycena belliarum]|uniref:Hydrophobin n=1 Tax=Mycena belliarum TaxID=1033014 RepID=A0AAD6TS16_9AGAR|nr:hypothetical protein B0H15DRAFT_861605 [Mycena belliae]
MFSKLFAVVACALITLAAADCSPESSTPPYGSPSVTTSTVAPSMTTSYTSPPVTTTTDAPSGTTSPSGPATTTSASTPPASPPTSKQCCTSVQNSSSSACSAVAALVGLDLSGLNVPVGLGCSPITVIGNNCGGTEVTCNAPEKQWGSLIAINCIPITL